MAESVFQGNRRQRFFVRTLVQSVLINEPIARRLLRMLGILKRTIATPQLDRIQRYGFILNLDDFRLNLPINSKVLDSKTKTH